MDPASREDKRWIWINSRGSFVLFLTTHSLRTYYTVACQCLYKDNAKHVSLVSTEKGVLAVLSVSRWNSAAKPITSHQFIPSVTGTVDPGQRALPKPAASLFLIWFLTSLPGTSAVGHRAVQQFLSRHLLVKTKGLLLLHFPCFSFFFFARLFVLWDLAKIDCRCQRRMQLSLTHLLWDSWEKRRDEKILQ